MTPHPVSDPRESLSLRHDPAAERAVIANAVHDPAAIDAAHDEDLSSADFYDHARGRLWQWLAGYYSDGGSRDDIALLAALRDADQRFAGIVRECIGTGAVRNQAHYARIVVNDARLRRMVEASRDAEQQAMSATDANEAAEAIESLIYDATAKRLQRRRVPTVEVLRRVVDEIERAAEGQVSPGLSTGYPSMDPLFQLYRGEFTILAGRPSMGKSTWAANVAEAVLHRDPGAVVAIGSLEQPADMHLLRMLSGWTKTPYSQLRQGKVGDLSALLASRERIERIAPRLVIDDTPSVTVAHFSAFLRRVRREFGRIDLAIFDHAHLAAYSARQTNENTGLTEVSHGLKAIPKIHDCPLLGLCQLNRSIEERKDQHPRRSDLRGSGSFEQDADNILFITRPAMWSNAPKDDKGQPLDDHGQVLVDDEAHLDLAKSRNGPLGRASLRFVGKEFRLYDTGGAPWGRIEAGW